jgi:aspartate carbamoyltransferase catalytic subunit
MRVVSGYADAIVLRHSDDDSAEIAAAAASVPIICAGAGKREHPTQALLDTYTIYANHGRLENLHVTIAGDLARGRTVYSLINLLAQFPKNHFTFVSAENSRIQPEMKQKLTTLGISFEEIDTLSQGAKDADVLYMTRVQKERCNTPEEYEAARKGALLTEHIADAMKEKAIIMHPLPRVDEIDPVVDKSAHAKYFEQTNNGVPVRMALLKTIFT